MNRRKSFFLFKMHLREDYQPHKVINVNSGRKVRRFLLFILVYSLLSDDKQIEFHCDNLSRLNNLFDLNVHVDLRCIFSFCNK